MADPTLPGRSQSPALYPSSPAAPSTDPRSTLYLPLIYRSDEELNSILQALPTKADIEALVGRVEASHKKETWSVKQEVQSLNTRLTAGESSLLTLEQRLTTLESQQKVQAESAVELQLRMEEFEDRSRRNNLRLRGLPVATGPTDLLATVTDIFRKVAGEHLPEPN